MIFSVGDNFILDNFRSSGQRLLFDHCIFFVIAITDSVDDGLVEEEAVPILIGVRDSGLVNVDNRPVVQNLCCVRRVVHIEAFIRVAADIIITSDLILSVANVINVLPDALEMPLKKLLKESAHYSAILGGALRWGSEVTGGPKNAAQEVSQSTSTTVKPNPLINWYHEHADPGSPEKTW